MSNGTQSLDRAAELLSLVVRAEEPVTYTSIVEQTGLARSTASRLLQSLERNGLLERDADGAFRGGTLFEHYARRFDRVEALVATAQPTLDRIADATGETVNLAVARAGTVVQVAQVDSSYMLGAMNWVGIDVPPHCSSLGKVMHAFGALPMPRGEMERRSPATITDPHAYREELELVRGRGFAITRGELEQGLDGVAAPVRGDDQRVVAAVGVSGPAFRLEDSHKSIGDLLVAESQRLTGLLARHARKVSPA
ncbi:helix-turn-helix domain-containing protein [Aeromicrobium sp. SMF47]|uniref:IclR family transcriptional regulator n=1 Tax=Aeromicrobium yanjiei TaxID=2662028 RepID=UPI00129E3CA9|nr:IclR family transcriptional regulator [Aeromicrobium yanjiei]MRJ76529.1 helix-turn-helix domain-containing protein [Aeromicrobium yanjiei]